MFVFPNLVLAGALFSFAPSSNPIWVGHWEYSDCWESLSGGSKECNWYRLHIQGGQTGLQAILKVDGHMAACTIKAEIKSKGSAIQVVFKEYCGAHLANEFKPGEVLFELSSDSGVVYTTWVAIQPSYTRLPAVQFERVKGSSK